MRHKTVSPSIIRKIGNVNRTVSISDKLGIRPNRYKAERNIIPRGNWDTKQPPPPYMKNSD